MNEVPETKGSALKAEFMRKSIHMLIALVPTLASWNLSYTALLVMGGTLFYTCAESLRFLGFSLPFISSLTESVLRKREYGHFALGPVTLGLGALLALLLFPPQVAAAGIYAMAFGDSISVLIGRFLGRIRPPVLQGKSLEGTLSCFVMVFITSFLVFHDWKIALTVGFISFLVDVLPLGDFDNLVFPLAACFGALIFF